MKTYVIKITARRSLSDGRDSPLRDSSSTSQPIDLSKRELQDLLSRLTSNSEKISCAQLVVSSSADRNTLKPGKAKAKAKRTKVAADREWAPADVKQWTLRSFSWASEIERINREVFKNDSFRPNQRAIINASICNKDLFVLMPTGYGKSLCFQLPAVYNDGATIVVSPLISLIHDQVIQMNLLGVKAIGLHSSNKTMLRLSEAVRDSSIKLIYTTPETILAPPVMNLLTDLHYERSIERFVIDEAHCVSKWGNDFRRQYLELRQLRGKFPSVPIQTYTATASREVINDVIHHLGLKSVEFFKSSFNRPNLYLQVFRKDKTAIQAPKPLLASNPGLLDEAGSRSRSGAHRTKSQSKRQGTRGKRRKGEKSEKLTKAAFDIAAMIRDNYKCSSGIVYCTTKKTCDLMATFLGRQFEGRVRVASYHAGKAEKEREKILRAFMNDEVAIVVATIAFGMGINKSDVRFIIHYNLPKSVEDYYQEIGRAGRDGLPAICSLFYDPSDKSLLDFFIGKDGKHSQAQRGNKKSHLYKLMLFCEVALLGEIHLQAKDDIRVLRRSLSRSRVQSKLRQLPV